MDVVYNEHFWKIIKTSKYLVLIDEFKSCINKDEQHTASLNDAARLADDFSLIHEVLFDTRQNANQLFSFKCHRQWARSYFHLFSFEIHLPVVVQVLRNHNSVNSMIRQQAQIHIFSSLKSQSSQFDKSFNSTVCNYTKNEGHGHSDCIKLKEIQ